MGPDGKPIAKLPLWQSFEMLMTPGSHTLTQLTQPETERARTIADSVLMRGVDFKHYGNDFATDAEGRVTLGQLNPRRPVPDQRLFDQPRPREGRSNPHGLHRQAR